MQAAVVTVTLNVIDPDAKRNADSEAILLQWEQFIRGWLETNPAMEEYINLIEVTEVDEYEMEDLD